jgi:hypothetical protein
MHDYMLLKKDLSCDPDDVLLHLNKNWKDKIYLNVVH